VPPLPPARVPACAAPLPQLAARTVARRGGRAGRGASSSWRLASGGATAQGAARPRPPPAPPSPAAPRASDGRTPAAARPAARRVAPRPTMMPAKRAKRRRRPRVRRDDAPARQRVKFLF